MPKFYWLKIRFWAYTSFLLPICLYKFSTGAPALRSLRAGIIGFFLYLLIYSLWKISARLHGIILPEKHAGFYIKLAGILLWLVWFATAQVVLTTYDELRTQRDIL